jgi:signal transduction histidine kinase
MTDAAPTLARVAMTLADMAHALESAEDSDERIHRTLRLLQDIVPHDRSALLEAMPGKAPALFGYPRPRTDERDSMTSQLEGLLARITLVPGPEGGARRRLKPSQLAVPLVGAVPVLGLDDVIGVLAVDRRVEQHPYGESDVQLMSVVASLLGAYVTMLHLREQDVALAETLRTDRDFQLRMMGIVSHDLRNPLAAIQNGATILMKDETTDRRAVLSRIASSAGRATAIVNDLLDVTEARSIGRIPIVRKSIDFVAVVRDCLDEIRLALPEKRIDLSSSVERAMGSWDERRIGQVITNLVGNAIRHSPPHTVIAVDVRLHGDALAFSVHNQGQPIGKQILPSIFDPFTKGGASPDGIGLGLFIVKQIVDSHGGNVGVESTDAAGTTFTVSLPCAGA